MLQSITVIVLILSIGLVSCLTKDGRVVNGTNAVDGVYPFMTSIQTASEKHFCAGTIIRPCWILTAAHCVHDELPKDLIVRYRVTDLNSKDKSTINVEAIHVHENYDRKNHFINDIAMLKLKDRIFFFYPEVTKVNLPVKHFELPANNMKATLIGWGYNATGGVLPNKLQQASLKVYSDPDCQALFAGIPATSQMCSGIEGGGMGQCHGDSGGPLLHDTPNGFVQVGIVSFGVGQCAQKPFHAGILTKVSHFIDWINKILSSHPTC